MAINNREMTIKIMGYSNLNNLDTLTKRIEPSLYLTINCSSHGTNPTRKPKIKVFLYDSWTRPMKAERTKTLNQ